MADPNSLMKKMLVPLLNQQRGTSITPFYKFNTLLKLVGLQLYVTSQ